MGNFPGALDVLNNPTPDTSQLELSHAEQHIAANDAIEALQAKVGINFSGDVTSLDYLVRNSPFTQNGSGMVLRSMQDKGRDIVHAKDRGCVGDGTTDETTALQELFTAAVGKVLMLDANKTYAYDIATGLSLSNVTLIANGSKFKRLTASAHPLADSEFNFIIGDDVDADCIEVECVGGAEDIGGVIVTGSRVNIGRLIVDSPASGSGTGASTVNAVRIGPNSGSAATDVHIGLLSCTNWDRPVVVQNLTRGSIGFLDVTNYRRGAYLKDVKNFTVHGGHIRTCSPNADGTAGDNAILMESSSAHFALSDIRLCNITLENSGEHGVRLGGATYASRNVWIENCHARAPGSGSAATGGCGFKALGPTPVAGARHSNIHVVNCSVWDTDMDAVSGGTNVAGVQFGKVFGGSIVNFVAGVTQNNTGYTEAGNSCENGIEIIGCQKVTITNPQIQRPSNAGVYIYDFSDGVNDWGQTDDITIVGGNVNVPGDAGVEVVCGVITMRRIVIDGMQVNGGNYTLKVAKSGTGAFVGCFANMHSISPATESYNGLGTDWTIHGRGAFVGTNACANGSIYQDTSSGNFKRRRGGTWCYQVSGSKTYDVPSLADAAGVTTTVTVAGAALGDLAQASFSLDTQGITVTAWVSAADTVSVRFQNESGGTVDLASGTLRALAEKLP